MRTLSPLQKATILLLSVFIFSCHTKKNVRGTENFNTDCVVLLDEHTAATFIQNYEHIFRGNPSDTRHTQWVYFPKEYFLFIDSFLRKNTDYEGIRFNFSLFDRLTDPQQQDERQIVLQIAAAKTNLLTHTQAFWQFQSKLTARYFGNSGSRCIEIVPNVASHSQPSQIGPDSVVFNSHVGFMKYMANYFNEYSSPNDKHSISLFLCRDNFTELGSFFKLPANQHYDGVRASFASYNSLAYQSRTQQTNPEQLTLILTPTINKQPHWNAFAKYLSDKFGEKIVKDINNLNHGELCPARCPQEVDQ